MDSFEWNKIFAAVLVAGIVAMLSGFVAEVLTHPEKLKENAVSIDIGSISTASANEGPKGPEPILALLAAADLERGQKLSKACAACHSFDQGGVNKVGPNLWNIVNAKKGSKPGFSYSQALLDHGGDWSFEELNQFLYKPKAFINGTKMNYIGLKKPQDRAAIVAWLNSLSDNPGPLPVIEEAQVEIEAEEADTNTNNEPQTE